jgi:hypothetical protein
VPAEIDPNCDIGRENGSDPLGQEDFIHVAPIPAFRWVVALDDRVAAIRDDRLKTTAVRSGDVDDNSCSHAESLNCFGRFGNHPNEADH